MFITPGCAKAGLELFVGKIIQSSINKNIRLNCFAYSQP